MSEPLSDFSAMVFDDLAPITVPVTIGTGTYLLKEATGDAACKFQNALLKATKLGPEGRPVSLEGLADAEPLLVSMCLFEVVKITNKAGDVVTQERPVPLHVVRGWKNKVQKDLFNRIKVISDIGGEEETEAVLVKRIADAQKKLDAIRAAKAEAEDASKNGDGGAMTATSSSA